MRRSRYSLRKTSRALRVHRVRQAAVGHKTSRALAHLAHGHYSRIAHSSIRMNCRRPQSRFCVRQLALRIQNSTLIRVIHVLARYNNNVETTYINN